MGLVGTSTVNNSFIRYVSVVHSCVCGDVLNFGGKTGNQDAFGVGKVGRSDIRSVLAPNASKKLLNTKGIRSN